MINRIKIKNFRSVKGFDQSGINNVLAFIGENSGGKSTILDSILVFWGYKKVSNLDFHFNEKCIEIGLCLDINDNSIQELINLCEKNEDDFYQQFKTEYNKKSNRGINTKKYRDELKSYFKSEILGSKGARYIYLLMKYEDTSDSQIEVKTIKYFISNREFKPVRQINPKDSIFKTFKPMIAYIGDERNFENEKFGKSNTTTNNILNVLLKSMKSNSNIIEKDNLKEKNIEELSILELNEILLDKIKSQSKEMLQRTNKLFQENYNNNIEVNWDFDNQLYESINILSTFNIAGEKEIDFLSIGSGTRNIYLLSLLQSYVEITANTNENQNILFIIEEPEIYLYPKLQDNMANILYDISKKHQMFITTHSGSIVQKFNIDDIYYVKRTNFKNKKDYSQIEKLEDFDILIESLGFNFYPIIKKEYVIFVEGKDDRKQYGKLIKKFYGIEDEKIHFVNLGGAGNIETSLNLQIMSHSNLRNKCLIIRDSDGICNEERLEKTTKELMKTVGKCYPDENEIKNMIYCTEESTLECLTMYPKYCNKTSDEEEFYNEYKEFLTKNKEFKEFIDDKLKNKKTIIMEKLYDNEYREDSLAYFRKYVVDKEIYKLIKKQTRGFKGIGNIEDEAECRELVPLLFEKLDMLFQR